MGRTIPAVRITAPGRNYGKTELACRLIDELRGRGYRVGAVKHSHHELPPDTPRSDSARMAAAGADAVVLCGRDGSLVRTPRLAPLLADALALLPDGIDVAVVEGYRWDDTSAVIRFAAGVAGRVCFETADGTPLHITHRDDVGTLADAVERELLMPAAPRLGPDPELV